MRIITTKQKVISLVTAAVMTMSAAGTALADDLEEQLEELQQKAAEQQEITNEAQQRVDNISEQLRVLQADVDEATAAYNEVSDQLITLFF